MGKTTASPLLQTFAMTTASVRLGLTNTSKHLGNVCKTWQAVLINSPTPSYPQAPVVSSVVGCRSDIVESTTTSNCPTDGIKEGKTLLFASGQCAGGTIVAQVATAAYDPAGCESVARQSSKDITYFSYETSLGDCILYTGTCTSAAGPSSYATYKLNPLGERMIITIKGDFFGYQDAIGKHRHP